MPLAYTFEKLVQESGPPIYTRARQSAKRSLVDCTRVASEVPLSAPTTPPISSFHNTAVFTSPSPA